MSDRLQLGVVDASLQHQQIAKLSVTILFDDVVHFVRVQELSDLLAEWESSNTEIIEGLTLGIELVKRFDAGSVAGTYGDNSYLGSRIFDDYRGWYRFGSSFNLASNSIENFLIFNRIFSVSTEFVMAGTTGKVCALRVGAGQRSVWNTVAVDIIVSEELLRFLQLICR